MLSNGELLESQRGPQGGYSLIKSAKEISVAKVIETMEGPISLTECASDNCGCSYESYCAVGKPWQKINKAISKASGLNPPDFDISIKSFNEYNSDASKDGYNDPR